MEATFTIEPRAAARRLSSGQARSHRANEVHLEHVSKDVYLVLVRPADHPGTIHQDVKHGPRPEETVYFRLRSNIKLGHFSDPG